MELVHLQKKNIYIQRNLKMLLFSHQPPVTTCTSHEVFDKLTKLVTINFEVREREKKQSKFLIIHNHPSVNWKLVRSTLVIRVSKGLGHKTKEKNKQNKKEYWD